MKRQVDISIDDFWLDKDGRIHAKIRIKIPTHPDMIKTVTI